MSEKAAYVLRQAAAPRAYERARDANARDLAAHREVCESRTLGTADPSAVCNCDGPETITEIIRSVGRLLEALSRHRAGCPHKGHGTDEAAARVRNAIRFARVRRGGRRARPGEADSTDQQAERMSACYRALEGLDLFGIRDGAVKRALNASKLAASTGEAVITWISAHKGQPPHKGLVTRFNDAIRQVFDATAALG